MGREAASTVLELPRALVIMWESCSENGRRCHHIWMQQSRPAVPCHALKPVASSEEGRYRRAYLEQEHRARTLVWIAVSRVDLGVHVEEKEPQRKSSSQANQEKEGEEGTRGVQRLENHLVQLAERRMSC